MLTEGMKVVELANQLINVHIYLLKSKLQIAKKHYKSREMKVHVSNNISKNQRIESKTSLDYIIIYWASTRKIRSFSIFSHLWRPPSGTPRLWWGATTQCRCHYYKNSILSSVSLLCFLVLKFLPLLCVCYLLIYLPF